MPFMKIMKKILLSLLLTCVASGLAFAGDRAAPSAKFALDGWKLQIPGPKEVTALDGYSSGYFYLKDNSVMCFDLDASETGHTKNSEYVRSELRHEDNWAITENRELSGTARVESRAVPDKVTVMQIHGITDDGKNAPPFLRIAVNSGNLEAFVKRSNKDDKAEKVMLLKNVRDGYFTYVVKLNNGVMTIYCNGAKKYEKDVTYWTWRNYFKLGCYPQAKSGRVQVFYKSFSEK